ncbi:LysR family transcriptional regulator [Moritella dasanensis]|uniref:LysR family transcriptional regulator n=1 Tax=Moritella dasanensis TaxID=428031 RepID=UPI0002D39B3E|nr:LysR family transcriptional regulator [Moritella dasanensis]
MLRFSFEQLASFVAVAEQGSFSKAAQSLGKDRSTLHQHVGNLEIDLGITLFDRRGKFPKITFEGRSLLTQVQHILYHAQVLQNSGDSLAEGLEASLTIYHDVSLPISVIEQVQRAVHQQYPQTQLHWLHRGREESINALAEQHADISIILSKGSGVLPSKGLTFTNLGFLPFSFFAHTDTALAQQVSCSLEDLEKQQQYTAENFMEVDLGKKTKISARVATISNMDIILSLLKQGGWALLPNHVVSSSSYAHEICKLNINFMTNDGRWSLVLLTRSHQSTGKVKSYAIEQFKAAFKDITR